MEEWGGGGVGGAIPRGREGKAAEAAAKSSADKLRRGRRMITCMVFHRAPP